MRPVTTLTLALLIPIGGCEPERKEATRPEPDEPRADRLMFPESAAAADPAVNRAVREALIACIDDDYDRFRASWSTAEPPMKRRKFERYWQPVRTIRVRRVQPMRHAQDGRLLYYVDAAIEFGVGAREPRRDVIFLVVRENDTWRLARAPKSLVNQVRGEQGQDAEP
jgi:hypothetical protein